MLNFLKKCRFLNGNMLKIIAAVSMLLDHIGVILYPRVHEFRYLGRIAFPIFAFLIAEGCRYTKNRAKYFCLLAGLAIVCQVVCEIATPDLDLMSVLMTFSFSVLLIFALQFFKSCLFNKAKILKTVLAGVLFVGGVTATYFIMQNTEFDYGFWGCMFPVFASVFDVRRVPAPSILQKLDCLPLRILCTAIPLFFIYRASPFPTIQLWSFCALPLLLLYGGKRGKWKMKYFFYIFYPLHLAALYGIYYFFY